MCPVCVARAKLYISILKDGVADVTVAEASLAEESTGVSFEQVLHELSWLKNMLANTVRVWTYFQCGHAIDVNWGWSAGVFLYDIMATNNAQREIFRPLLWADERLAELRIRIKLKYWA